VKLLFEGRKDVGPWWVGKRGVCLECGREIELERSDDKRVEWVPADEALEVRLICGNCRNVITVVRSPIPN
jgi:hypothetical protein